MGLIAAGTVGLAVSTIPFAVGLLLGYPFEQSMNWAVSVISESKDEEAVEGEEADKKDKEEERPSNTEDDGKKAVTDVKEEDKPMLVQIREALLSWCYKNEIVLYTHMALAAFAFLYGIFGVFFSRKKDQYLLYVSLSLLWLLGNFFSITYHMGWPALIEVKRAVVFMRYATIALYLIPLEALYLLLKISLKERIVNFLFCMLCFGVIGLLIYKGQLRNDNIPYWEMQSDGAMKLCLELADADKDFTWTVVSPVNDRSCILNYGYHYELLDFVEEMDRWKESRRFTIPTKEVYFVIEKYPLRNRSFSCMETEVWKQRDPVDRSLVKEAIQEGSAADRSELYQTQRDVIMSKAYFWAKEYEKYYPREMKVYYEDEEVVIYRLVQNMYCLDNLSIYYGQ